MLTLSKYIIIKGKSSKWHPNEKSQVDPSFVSNAVVNTDNR